MNLKYLHKVQDRDRNYSRVANIMRGVVPNIHTFAFLTVENPEGITATKEYNAEANKKLEKSIRDYGYGYTKTDGFYNTIENSYFVPNILKEDALALGNLYEQESIIFAERVQEADSEGMRFGMYLTYPDIVSEPIDWKDIFKYGEGKNSEGKEFWTRASKNEFLRKFHIPFFNEAFDKVKWNSTSGLIPKSSTVPDSLIKELNQAVMLLHRPGITDRSKFIHKNFIKKKIKDFYGE